MKRSVVLNAFAGTNLVLYIVTLLTYYVLFGSILPTWFSLGLFFIGDVCLLKAFFFNHDSSFWAGSVLLFSSIVGFLSFFHVIPSHLIVCCYFLCPILSSILCAIFYKKTQHYKISFILILEDFWILLYSINIINLLWFIILSVITILICFRGILCSYPKKTVTTKNK